MAEVWLTREQSIALIMKERKCDREEAETLLECFKQEVPDGFKRVVKTDG
jgi:hypothetical protein